MAVRLRKSVPLFTAANRMHHNASWQPAVDIYHCRGGWLVKFELAGVAPQEIAVTLPPTQPAALRGADPIGSAVPEERRPADGVAAINA